MRISAYFREMRQLVFLKIKYGMLGKPTLKPSGFRKGNSECSV